MTYSLTHSFIYIKENNADHRQQKQQHDLFQKLHTIVQSLPRNFESKIRADLLRVLSQMNLDSVVDQVQAVYSFTHTR